MHVLAFVAPEISAKHPHLSGEFVAELKKISEDTQADLQIMPETTELAEAGWDDLFDFLKYGTTKKFILLLYLPGQFVSNWDSDAPSGLARMVRSTIEKAGKTPVVAAISHLSPQAAAKLNLMGIRHVVGQNANDVVTHIYKDGVGLKTATAAKKNWARNIDGEVPSLSDSYIRAQSAETSAKLYARTGRSYAFKEDYNYAASTISLYKRLRASAERAFKDERAIRCGVFAYDLESRIMSVEGQDISLSKTEAIIIKNLLANPEGKASQNQILAEIHGGDDYDAGKADQTFRVQLHRLRAKLAKAVSGKVSGLEIITSEPASPYEGAIFKHAVIEDADLRKPSAAAGGTAPAL